MLLPFLYRKALVRWARLMVATAMVTATATDMTATATAEAITAPFCNTSLACR